MAEREFLDKAKKEIAKKIENLFQEKSTEFEHYSAIIDIFIKTIIAEEKNSKYKNSHQVINHLAICYLKNHSAWKIYKTAAKVDKIPVSPENAFKFLVEELCVKALEAGVIEAIKLLTIIVTVNSFQSKSENIAKKCLKDLENAHQKETVQQLELQINKKNELLYFLFEINEEAGSTVAIEWLKQKSNERKYIAMQCLQKMKNLSVEHHEEIQNALKYFWRNKKLRDDVNIRKAYYSLVSKAYDAQVLDRKKASNRLCGLFRNSGYTYPADKDEFRAALRTIEREKEFHLYSKGFIRASTLKNPDNDFGRQDEELAFIIKEMEEKDRKEYLKELVLKAVNPKITWRAPIMFLDYASENEVEEVFRFLLRSDNLSAIGSISQLIARISAKDYGLKDKAKKWKFLSEVLIEEAQNASSIAAFKMINAIACWGTTTDILKVADNFQSSFEADIELREIVYACLAAIYRLGEDKEAEVYLNLILNFFKDKKSEIVKLLTQAIDEDWRGVNCHAEVLASSALKFINFCNANAFIKPLISTINNKRRDGDLAISVNSKCAKFLIGKAIQGEMSALEALIEITESHIWKNVSKHLLQVYQNSESTKIKNKALEAIIDKYLKSMRENYPQDPYVHLEMETLKQIKELPRIQNAFMEGIRLSLINPKKNTNGIHNAIKEISNFVLPAFQQKAQTILIEALKIAEKEVEKEVEKYQDGFSKNKKLKHYSLKSEMVNKELLKLSA